MMQINFSNRVIREMAVVGVIVAACGPAKNETDATDSGGATIDPSTSGTSGKPATDDGGETTGTSTSGTSDNPVTTGGAEVTTGGAPPECACIVDDPGRQWVDPSLPTCVGSICPTVVAAFEEACDTDCNGQAEVDAVALECALVALRDRTPGLIRWSLKITDSAATDDGYVWIREDGGAIWRKWESEGVYFEATAAQLVALPASAVYEQCLAELDGRDRFDCLRQSLAGPENLVCDLGWIASGI